MKKSIIIFLLIVLQCSLVACNVANTKEQETTQIPKTTTSIHVEKEETKNSNDISSEEETYIAELKLKLVSDWSAYLWFEEYLYGDILWAISYIDTFIEEPTWENLQIARAVLCTAESYIRLREAQEHTLTTEEYNLLIKQGYDISHIPMEMGTTAQDTQNALSWCTQLKYGLFSDIYLDTSFKDFSNYVENLAKLCETMIDYIGYTTNYLLVTLEDADLTKRLQNFINENYMYLTKYFPVFLDDAISIENAAMTTFEELNDIIAKMQQFLGDMTITYDDLREFIENGNEDTLAQLSVPIKGLSFYLPQVPWESIEKSDYQYYNKTENGSAHFLEERQSILKSADGCIIQYTQVNKEEVIQYKEMLSNLGILPIDVVEENGILTIYYIFSESSFVIEWENNIVTLYMLDGEICFTPMWYTIK